MPTSLLYVRTDTTTKNGGSGTLDPRNLPADQVLEFVQPNRMLEGIAELYDNIVTKQVSVNQTGIRRIFLRDDGMKAREFTITGRLDKVPLADAVDKLMKFRYELMRTDLHPHGRIGFLSGNSTNFNVDPDANADTSTAANLGLMIGHTEIGYTGRLIRRLTFRATLIFGGTVEAI